MPLTKNFIGPRCPVWDLKLSIPSGLSQIGGAEMPKMAASLRSSLNPFLSFSRISQALYSPPLQSSPSKCHCRPFSHNPERSAAIGTPQLIRPKAPAQMSMRNVVKASVSGANRDMMPDDIGILPGTFIRPVWKNMPSIFWHPKQRLQMEWLSLKMRVQNFIR